MVNLANELLFRTYQSISNFAEGWAGIAGVWYDVSQFILSWLQYYEQGGGLPSF